MIFAEAPAVVLLGVFSGAVRGYPAISWGIGGSSEAFALQPEGVQEQGTDAAAAAASARPQSIEVFAAAA